MSSIELPVLQGRRVTLRQPRDSDVEARRQLGADAEIIRMYGGSIDEAGPMSSEAARAWVRQLCSHSCAWVIEADTLIGHIRLDRADLQGHSVSLAIRIDDKTSLGQGLGTEAIRLVLDYAFNVLKVHRVSLRVREFNDRAIRAYKKCGFVVEGREREAILADGQLYDDIIMGLLDREYFRTPN